ncbi:cohesin domain-containing protein [Paenibacillus eucommiae]|nr:cohesin domain-containing protein [Paenibacillus eucommiae]
MKLYRRFARLFTALMIVVCCFSSTVLADTAQFPIGIYMGPAPEDVADAKYAEIKEMNANFIVHTNLLEWMADNDRALDLAGAHGLKILVSDVGVRWEQEELVTQQIAGSTLSVRAGHPVGQTFTTTADTNMTSLAFSFKTSQWPADAQLTLSLYDNPSKSNLIGTAVPKVRQTKDYPLFELRTPVQPNTSYYMEITSSSMENVDLLASTTDVYSGGKAYVNHVESSVDLYFISYYFGSRMAITPTDRPSDSYLAQWTSHYKSNPAVLGYHLYDEPVFNLLPTLKATTDKINEYDPDHMVFVNLAVGGVGVYQSYGGFITPAHALGQTIRTHDDQTSLDSITLSMDRTVWSSATLTLWDSSAKTVKIGESQLLTRPDSNTPTFQFDSTAVQPDTNYYLELTVDGNMEGQIWANYIVDPNGTGTLGGTLVGGNFWMEINDRDVTGEEFVRAWVDKQPDVLSFDVYPFLADGTLLDKYFVYQELFRRESLRGQIVLWSYIQSVGINGSLRAPNEDELRYHIYTNLAYGVKGITYFTYNTPSGPGNDAFHDGLLLRDGSKNASYTWAKNLNAEVLKLGPTLLGLTSDAVYHTGTLPKGTKALPTNFFWQPADANQPMVISSFTNESGRKYVMVVNRDTEQARTLSFTLPAKPATVHEISKSTGAEVNTNYNSTTGTLSSSFAAGEGRLYALDAAFSEPTGSTSTLSTGVSSIPSGTQFTVKYGLKGVAESVYAQDINFEYDPAVMEFVSAKSIRSGVSIVKTVQVAGTGAGTGAGTDTGASKLRLILASEGAGHAVSGDADLVELTFKAKNVSQTAAGIISIASALLGNAEGNEHSAAPASVSIQVTAGLPGDFNHDGKVSIGDLAVLAAHYGKSTSSPDWKQVKHLDLSGDGSIDIADLAAIAQKIVQ